MIRNSANNVFSTNTFRNRMFIFADYFIDLDVSEENVLGTQLF